MIFRSVLRWYGYGLLVLCAAMLPVAVQQGLSAGRDSAAIYLGPALLCLCTGMGLVFATKGERDEVAHGGMREVVLILVGWWMILPFFAGLPFMAQGMGLADAWFEAVSAMTTTGAWLSQEAARADYGAMLWRASLQWLGGYASLCAAGSLFIRPVFIGIDDVTPPFAAGEENSTLRALRKALRTFGPFYAILTVFGLILLILTGVSPGEALILSLSLLASGGFVPEPVAIEAYGLGALAAIGVLMTLGAVNFIFVLQLMRQRRMSDRERWGRDKETELFILLCIVTGTAFVLSAESPTTASVTAGFFNAVSVMSTNGFYIGDAPAMVPALIAAIIGGAAISTAGGVKLLRWLTTMKRAGDQIWTLIHPRGVIGQSRTVNELGIWIHYISFTLVLAILVLAICIQGTSLETSVAAATAVVSNCGSLLALAPDNPVDYAMFDPLIRPVLAFGMILGRLEMLVTLAILNRVFWRS